jgi:hypothetical protein
MRNSLKETAVPANRNQEGIAMTTAVAATIKELMIYDAGDSDSTKEAKEFLSKEPAGTAAIEGIMTLADLNKALARYSGLKQVSFCTHGFPGQVQFDKLTLDQYNILSVNVPLGLFTGLGRLLFMGCSVAAPPKGEDFLVAAGKRFFSGKGGIVGGSTVDTVSWPGGTRLPKLSFTSFAIGYLILLRLDNSGKVVLRKAV